MAVWGAVKAFSRHDVTGAAGAAPTTLSMGQAGIVTYSGGRAPVFESRDDFDEAAKLVAAGDREGYAKLALRAMPIETGTHVRVLESTWSGGKRVRIIDGQYAGSSGWLPMEWIGPDTTPPPSPAPSSEPAAVPWNSYLANESTPAGIAASDFQIVHYQAVRMYGSLSVTGEIKNGGRIAAGVELEAVARDANGNAVDTVRFWPNSQKNVAPGNTVKISTSVSQNSLAKTIDLTVAGVRIW
jgi:hypothetical protein